MREHGKYGTQFAVGSSPPALGFPKGARLTHVEVHVGAVPAIVKFNLPKGGVMQTNFPANLGRVDFLQNGDLPILSIEFTNVDFILAEFVS